MLIAAMALAAAMQALPAEQPETTRVRQELLALHDELNRARRARDRAALERIYAPEFRWVHGVGYADDRARQIDSMLEAGGDSDLPPPGLDPPNELIVLGDTAVLRRPAFVAGRGAKLYSTHIFVRRDGRWQILHMQGTPLLPERAWISLPAAALTPLAGSYRNPDSGTLSRLWVADGLLRRQVPGQSVRTLRPVSPDLFYDDIGTEYRFTRSADGLAARFTFRFALDGPQGRAERVR